MRIKFVLLCFLSLSVPVIAQSGESTSDLEKELDLDDLSDDPDETVEQKKPEEENPTAEKKETAEPSKKSVKENVKQTSQTAKTKKNNGRKSKTISRDTTKVDFDAAAIEGERKLPQNMFLNGQIKQDFSQMIHLRRNFRNELRNSGAAVRALVK